MKDEQMCGRVLSDDALRRIPPIQIGPGHERNPFHKVVGDPVGSKNSHRWTVVHGWRSEGDARPVEPSSPEDALLAALAGEKSGFHRSEGGSHGFAMFPNVPNYAPDSPARRELEAAWEEKCLAMHRDQGSIRLDDDPPEFRGFENLRRGD